MASRKLKNLENSYSWAQSTHDFKKMESLKLAIEEEKSIIFHENAFRFGA